VSSDLVDAVRRRGLSASLDGGMSMGFAEETVWRWQLDGCPPPLGPRPYRGFPDPEVPRSDDGSFLVVLVELALGLEC